MAASSYDLGFTTVPLQYLRANEQRFGSATSGSYEKAVKSLYMLVVLRYGETNVGTAVPRTLPFILSFHNCSEKFPTYIS